MLSLATCNEYTLKIQRVVQKTSDLERLPEYLDPIVSV